jgi:lysophospholipase L1-like esterase
MTYFRTCCAITLIFLALAATPARAADTPVEPGTGVTRDPCAGVPLQPTAEHQASPDPWSAWMRDWMARDWAQRCRYAGENAGLPAAGLRRVVLMGDSITEGWKENDPAMFGPELLDRGISGQTTEQMLLRMRQDVIDLHPAVVQVMAGTNDIAGNRGPTTLANIQGNIAGMCELASAHGIRVVLASILPAARIPWQPQIEPVPQIAAMNEWLRHYAEEHHYVYVDYHAALDDGHGGLDHRYSEDGVHPNAAGYRVMRPLLDAAVARALRDSRGRQVEPRSVNRP